MPIEEGLAWAIPPDDQDFQVGTLFVRLRTNELLIVAFVEPENAVVWFHSKMLLERFSFEYAKTLFARVSEV